jgi:curli production assembly/transport component CsgF
MSKRSWTIAAIIAIGVTVSAPALASELVYHPVNPTFGGNPLNGSFLLSTAQAQGQGTKSGAQSPDLSGLTNALSNLGSTIVVSPNNTGTSTASPN